MYMRKSLPLLLGMACMVLVNYGKQSPDTAVAREVLKGIHKEQTDGRNGRYIVIQASSFTLSLFDSNDKLLKVYKVGLGKNGIGKKKWGDGKTPRGEYKIVWKASRFSDADGGYPIVDEKAFCTPDNKFTTDPKLADPEENLWTEGYGGNEAVVMCLDYPNESDVKAGCTGGCIEIHATHLGGIGAFCSAGCPRMQPKDARELYQYVTEGTKVCIRE